MKAAERRIVGAAVSLLVSVTQTFAVVDQAVEIQGTNIVLSWPSEGYESYMIEYRETLDPSTPWVQLTNAYPANSTNRSTFVIQCCGFEALSSGSTNGGSGELPPFPSESMSPEEAEAYLALQNIWVMPADGSGSAVPLALYPPGMDTSGLVMVEAPEEYQVEAVPSSSGALESGGGELNGPLEIADEGCGCPATAFFRVWHIPDFPSSITNYAFDGPIFIPVDFKDYMDRVENIEVLMDGQQTADSVFMSLYYGGQTNWGMGIYFDLFPSGTHQIQLLTTLRLNDEVGDGTVSLVLSNVARNITIDNEVAFPNWEDLIMSTNCTFQAQTKTNDTDWWIDVYDAGNNYVNGGSGHTTNGLIEWTWDLTDTLGNPRDDLDSDPFFYSYITFATAAGQQTTRTTPAKQTEYPNVGQWLFTYADRHYLDAGSNYVSGNQYYTNGIQAMQGGPSFRGIPNSQYPTKFGTNIYTQAERNESWDTLKGIIFSEGRIRNFYYHGHGSANRIGSDRHVFDTNGFVTGGISLPGSKAYLTSQSVSNQLTFNRYGGSRPYRFVWLDGCSTANGNWPGAFGVDKVPYGLEHYTNSATNSKHRRPSAFVGWNQTVGGQGWGSSQAAWAFRSEWMHQWYYSWQTEGLWQAFRDARPIANWPPGGDTQLFGALRVYGYTNLLMNGYNQKNDWRWP